jgi:hypothetical protein
MACIEQNASPLTELKIQPERYVMPLHLLIPKKLLHSKKRFFILITFKTEGLLQSA